MIDTGSNTIRLAVFEVSSSYPFPSVAIRSVETTQTSHAGPSSSFDERNCEIKEIVDLKNTAGLSNYVKNGVFTRAGVDKAVSVLREQIKCAENLGCDETFIFATAVLRNVKNSREATLSIEEAIGKRVELLGGEEEAGLGLKGAFYGTDVESGVLIDLGGGSCEITKFSRDDFETASLKVGCVSTYSQFVASVLPNKKECGKIVSCVRAKLKSCSLKLQGEKGVWGIGGSVRAIAKFTREMKNLEKTPKHVRLSDIKDMLDFLKKNENGFAHIAVKAVPDRIHSVVPGCIIIGEILKATGAIQLDICKGGLREGFLLKKLTCTSS